MAESIYHGVLLGYLPNAGEFEVQHYEGAIMLGRFADPLKGVLLADSKYLFTLIGRHCRIVINGDGCCINMELNESPIDSETQHNYPYAQHHSRIIRDYINDHSRI